MTVPLRAALYLRVSTARQPFLTRSVRAKPTAPHADTGSSKPMSSRALRLSATNGRRPEFQRMIETGTSKPASFDVVIAKKERVVGLKATRDQAQADAERARSCSKAQARANRRLHPRWSASSPGRRVNGYGSKEPATGATISHRALAQRVEVADKEALTMGSKSTCCGRWPLRQAQSRLRPAFAVLF